MKKADEVLRAFIPVLGSREARNYINLFSSWSHILGDDLEDIAAHTEPVDVKNGSLIIFTDHPGWMQKLEFHKARILKRLQKRHPELRIRSIFVQRVSNERFIERREARLMGNTPPSAASQRPVPTQKTPMKADGPTPASGQNPDSPENREVHRKIPEDPELAETFRRLEKLGRSEKQGK